MRFIIGELGNLKSTNFGSRDNFFNVLNVPDELYANPRQFWVEHNEPWLTNAIDRGDYFPMATRPSFDNRDVRTFNSVLVRENPVSGKAELSGLGREYLTMRRAGYVYRDGEMMK